MQKTKDVLAALAAIMEVWVMTKTLHWWSGLEAWQAVLFLASIYLIWWAIDRYYHKICDKVDALQKRIAAEETSRNEYNEKYEQQVSTAFSSIRAKTRAPDDRAETS